MLYLSTVCTKSRFLRDTYSLVEQLPYIGLLTYLNEYAISSRDQLLTSKNLLIQRTYVILVMIETNFTTKGILNS